jgi:hypothetical protein
MGLGGFLYDLSGRNLRLIYGICGVMMVILSTLVMMSRAFREFLAYAPPPPAGNDAALVAPEPKPLAAPLAAPVAAPLVVEAPSVALVVHKNRRKTKAHRRHHNRRKKSR